ncbi:MAG: sigma-70 family RNA polymerase sigma factor [Maricaulaceae bacterium]
MFQENESILKGFIRRNSPSSVDVEDITQETILRALQAEREREIREPRAYLFSIARNVVRDALDRKSRSIIDFIEDFGSQTDISDEPLVDEQVDSRQRMRLFWEAVATLPQQCQRVFVLKKVYGYSHQEISKELGISISTTEKHAAAGLKRCSEFMDRRMQAGSTNPGDRSVENAPPKAGPKSVK